MPLFFFHFPGDESTDTDGIEFLDAKTARREAIRTAGHVIFDLEDGLERDATWKMCVTDESGETVCALEFRATDVASPLAAL